MHGMNWSNDYISWKPPGRINEAAATSDDVSGGTQFLSSALIPRPTGPSSASLGNGQFGTVKDIHHMGRPRPKIGNEKLSRSQNLINSCNPKNDGSGNDNKDAELSGETCSNIDWESGTMWDIDDLVVQVNSNTGHNSREGDGETVTYTYRLDSCCPLGYNPMKQVVCPRFVGWISTYEPMSLNESAPIPHISPYSFFIDVARGSRPMVAFAACPRADEFSNDSGNAQDDDDDNAAGTGSYWKDAQRDAELTGVFCVNLVSEELAWAMNASAAPLGKDLSEFRLMEKEGHNTVPTPVAAPTINAPFVPQSPAFMECRYVKTGESPNHKPLAYNIGMHFTSFVLCSLFSS